MVGDWINIQYSPLTSKKVLNYFQIQRLRSPRLKGLLVHKNVNVGVFHVIVFIQLARRLNLKSLWRVKPRAQI